MNKLNDWIIEQEQEYYWMKLHEWDSMNKLNDWTIKRIRNYMW